MGEVGFGGLAEGAWYFGVLGPLVLTRDGTAVSLRGGYQRSLLALLLLARGAPLSRDRLIDELWGERPPATAVSALHVHLSGLRAILGDLLVTESGGYVLRPENYRLDVRRLDELIEEAVTAPDQAELLLSEALALFRGEPLCDVACEGSVAGWRRILEEKRLHALLAHSDARLAAGAGVDLIAELEQRVTEHPFEERLWGQLMLALYRAGRQADALDAYQRARRLLAAEMGLAPGPQLEGLHQRMLERDPELFPLQQPRVTPSPAAVRRSHLPQPLTKLIGRERELAALDGLMVDPDVRLLTITGTGGVGKTRILLELARRLELHYADGAVLVLLERLTDPALVAAEIAETLARRDGIDGLGADELAGFLRERELLLVIDNFEHLISAAVLVSELLALSPRSRVLVSSRIALRLRGEHTFQLEPLELPTAGADAADSPAVELFLQCALAAERELVLDPEVIGAGAEICRALDGLPLAIELAASRCRSLTPAQIAGQLTQPLVVGEHGLRDLPDRQQTLAATIRWSYDLLTPGAREVLRAASAFLGGFDREALAAVVGRSSDAELDELLEASLARREPDRRRFSLLELVRAFALEELEASGAAPAIRGAHCRHFAAIVAPASAGFEAGDPLDELAGPLLPDHANLRLALEDALAAGDGEHAVGLALGLRPVWFAGMLRHESQDLVDRLLASLEIEPEHELALLRVVAHIELSTANTSDWSARLAARAQALDDLEAFVLATCNLFGHALNVGDRDQLEHLTPELLALTGPDTSPRGLGWIHYFLAAGDYLESKFDAASEGASRSAELATAIGHDFMLASAVVLGLLAGAARDRAIDQPALAAALELVQRPKLKPLVAVALWLVARYAADLDAAAATRWLAHGERIRAELGVRMWETALRDETMAALGLQDLETALAATPPLDHRAALAEAMAWVAASPSGTVKQSSRPGVVE